MTRTSNSWLIDEIDTHFPPDLQATVIEEIRTHCADHYCPLSSQQSPAVMHSVEDVTSFSLLHSSEVAVGYQQDQRLDSDYGFESLAESILPLSNDLRLVTHVSAML